MGYKLRVAIGPHDDFPALLRSYRERAGRSRNNLAHEVGVDPSYLTRIEHGDRASPREHIITAVARVLQLTLVERNILLTAGGFAAPSLSQLGHWDDAIQAVVDVLNDPNLTPEVQAEFRTTICNISRAYRALATYTDSSFRANLSENGHTT